MPRTTPSLYHYCHGACHALALLICCPSCTTDSHPQAAGAELQEIPDQPPSDSSTTTLTVAKDLFDLASKAGITDYAVPGWYEENLSNPTLAYFTTPEEVLAKDPHLLSNIQKKYMTSLYLYQIQGGREYQEDRGCYYVAEDKTLIGLFDGHGGSYIAELLKRHLLPELAAVNFECPDQEQLRNEVFQIYKAIDQALYDAVEIGPTATEGEGDSKRLVQKLIKSYQELLATNQARKEEQAGATATVAVITAKYIHFINLGDARGVAISNYQLLASTKDHKPGMQAERERIEAAGGKVTVVRGEDCPRLDGRLAVARCFGDFAVGKKINDSTQQLQQAPPLSYRPDIQRIERREGQAFTLLLSSDGGPDFWDRVSVQDARPNFRLARWLKEASITKRDTGETLREKLCNFLAYLENYCKENSIGSPDNTTIWMIDVPPPSSATE